MSLSLGPGAGLHHLLRGVGDDLCGGLAHLLLLMPTFNFLHELIILFFLVLKPLGQNEHRALPLCLVQLGVLLHQENACSRFLYIVNNMLLTRVVGMLVEQLEPAVGDCDALLLGIVFAHFKRLLEAA